MRFSILTFLLLLSAILPAQSPDVCDIEAKIEQFHFGEAEKLLDKHDDAALANYYRARILFLKNILTDDPLYEEPFYARCKSAIDALEAAEDNSGKAQAMEAEIYFQRGAIRFVKKKYFNCVRDLKKACEMLQENAKKYPDNIEQMKLLGTFHLVLSAVPKKMQWLSGMLCFEGDVETGLLQLAEAGSGSKLLRQEAEVVLFFYEKNFISDPEGANRRIAALAKPVDNYLYNLLLASSWSELGQNDKALGILDAGDKYKHNKKIFFTPLWDLYRARAHYYKLDYDKAILHFSAFAEAYRGQAFRGDALFRQGVAYELSGDRASAVDCFGKLIDSEISGFDADDYAYNMAKRYIGAPMRPVEKRLFEARNLFDGGYYERSLSMLFPLSDSLVGMSEDEKAEYHYRLGRNYQETKKVKLARYHYNAARHCQPGENLWMKVYAIYYLGRLEESEEKYAKAAELYREVLAHDHYYYQSGLERRCKSSLQQAKKRLKNPHREK